MLDSRLLEIDPETGEVEMMHFDDTDGSVIIETRVDVEPLIELNKAQFNAFKRGDRHGDMAKVMSIPPVIYYEEMQKGTWRDKKATRRFINDPDNAVFRTRPGTY